MVRCLRGILEHTPRGLFSAQNADMRVQDAICRYTEDAVTNLYRAARRVSEDKLAWAPMAGGRTVLDQLQECAQSALWYLGYLEPGYDHGYADIESMWQARRQWKSVDECERITRGNTADFLDRVRALPDEALDARHEMPWGETMTGFDVISFQYWNLTYHLGQIMYIQTLYGDMEM